MSNYRDKYDVVIGLEVHAQLNTKSKAYSNDPNEFGAIPNTNISPVTLGHPGTLPKPNTEVINHAIRLGLACGSEITKEMHYARKNYFYPDLPKGYQITQDTTPICTGGKILIKKEDGTPKEINITRIHMEEDAGKSMHDQDPFDTLVDLNRAGVPLVEIVTEPEMRSSTEAYSYLTEIRKLVRYLDICDGNMEEGSLRCDANISIMPKGSTKFGERCEVKNMNSIRNVQRAIEHEIDRQAEIIENGGTIHMETRNFNAVDGTTTALRSKEQAHDYRYFPEPDLQPLLVTQDQIEAIRSELPPLPNDLFKKYCEEYGLTEYDATVLTDSKGIALYFEQLIAETSNYKAAANWVINSVKSHLNKNAQEINEFPLAPKAIADLIKLIEEGKISNAAATQRIFPALVQAPKKSALDLANELNLIQESDEGELERIVQSVFDNNPSETERLKGGEKKLIGFFMGQIMKESKGKADPKSTNKIIQKLLQ